MILNIYKLTGLLIRFEVRNRRSHRSPSRERERERRDKRRDKNDERRRKRGDGHEI